MVFIWNPWGSVRGRSRDIKKTEDDKREERIGMKKGESLGGRVHVRIPRTYLKGEQ